MKKLYPETISIHQSKANLDSACESAVKTALMSYGIDKYGHSKKIDWDRSTDSLKLSFKTIEIESSMAGTSFIYLFDSFIERDDDN